MKKLQKRGRPTKYRPIYCKKLLEYFEDPPITVLKTAKIPDFPTIEGFCQILKISKVSLHAWTKKHKDFMNAYMRAREIQEHLWLTGAMNGKFNSQFAIFAGKNMFGWKDKSEQENKHTGTINIKRVSNL